jgi:hypothetical protein
MSVSPISFTEALKITADTKRHLLLGNGFSIALFRDRFSYVSLLGEGRFHRFPRSPEGLRPIGNNGLRDSDTCASAVTIFISVG